VLSSTVAHHFALRSCEDMSCCCYRCRCCCCYRCCCCCCCCCSYTHHDYKRQTELECKHDMCRALHGTLVLFKQFSNHSSVYRATVVSGPWSPSKGAPILLYPQMVSSNLVLHTVDVYRLIKNIFHMLQEQSKRDQIL
jgi:hypothetical protein